MVTSWTCMFLMLFVMVITADKDKVCDSNSQVHAAGLCGPTLTEVMLLVCAGRGFNSRTRKRGMYVYVYYYINLFMLHVT